MSSSVPEVEHIPARPEEGFCRGIGHALLKLDGWLCHSDDTPREMGTVENDRATPVNRSRIGSQKRNCATSSRRKGFCELGLERVL